MAQGSITYGYDLLIIGGSAGSLEVLLQVLPILRLDLGLSIVIVLHRKPGDSFLAELLHTRLTWPVVEAEEKMILQKGTVYVAPADYHLLIEKDGTLSLDYSEKINYSRPSIDASFETAADAFGERVVALLLSGANADGAIGLKKVLQAGGLTIAQQPEDAMVSYMPKRAIDIGAATEVLNAAEMADRLNKLNRFAD